MGFTRQDFSSAMRDNATKMVRAMRDQYESIGCVAHTFQLEITQAVKKM